MNPKIDLKTYLSSTDRGTGAKVARALRIPSSLLSAWAKGRPVPEDRAPALEEATGFHVKVETTCPGAVWVRVPDPSWPGGRPLLDKTGREAVQELPQTAGGAGQTAPAAPTQPPRVRRRVVLG